MSAIKTESTAEIFQHRLKALNVLNAGVPCTTVRFLTARGGYK